MSTPSRHPSVTQVSKNGRLKIDRSYAAQCPDKEHILENAEGDFSEYIRIGDDVFYRKNSSQWIQGTPGPDFYMYYEWDPAVTIEPPDRTPPGKAPTAP